MTAVDFYYAIGSRYSYLASTQLAAIERDCGCRFDWYPLNSRMLMERRGIDPFAGAPVSGQYEWPYRERDALRWAALYGVPFVEPRGRVEFDLRLLALAATAGKRLGAAAPYSRRLFAAMFVDPLDRIDRAECVRRAESCGLAAERFVRELDDARTARDLDAAIGRAHQCGVFGVPTFTIDGELFWGNDRLVLLRRYLDSRR